MTTLPGNGSAGDERDDDTQATAGDAAPLEATASEPTDRSPSDDDDTLVLDTGEDAPATTPTGASSSASAPYRADPYPRTATPRVRSGAIAWGAIVVLAAVAVLLVQLNPAVAAAYATWQASLTLGTVALLGVVAVGALVLLFAVLSAIRHAQRRARGETR